MIFPRMLLATFTSCMCFQLVHFLIDLLQHGNGKTLGFNGSLYSSLIMVHLLLAWVVKTIINPSDWSAIHLVNRNSMSHKKATETLVKQYRKTKKRPQTNSALTVTDFVPYTFVCFPMPFQFQLLHGNKKTPRRSDIWKEKRAYPPWSGARKR